MHLLVCQCVCVCVCVCVHTLIPGNSVHTLIPGNSVHTLIPGNSSPCVFTRIGSKVDILATGLGDIENFAL